MPVPLEGERDVAQLDAGGVRHRRRVVLERQRPSHDRRASVGTDDPVHLDRLDPAVAVRVFDGDAAVHDLADPRPQPEVDRRMPARAVAEKRHQAFMFQRDAVHAVGVGKDDRRRTVVGEDDEPLARRRAGGLGGHVDAETAEHLDARGMEPLAGQPLRRLRVRFQDDDLGAAAREGQGRGRPDRAGTYDGDIEVF